MYEHINIILGTKHKKEEAIREPFETAFGANLYVPDDYDTDQFGTFTNQVTRLGSAEETVIKKAKQAASTYPRKRTYGLAVLSRPIFL